VETNESNAAVGVFCAAGPAQVEGPGGFRLSSKKSRWDIEGRTRINATTEHVDRKE